MRPYDYAAAAALIRRAHDITNLASTDYEQDHGYPWTHNTRIHYRQSTIIALLRGHEVLDVVEDLYVAWGRIKIVDPEGGPPLLLKPRASLLDAVASNDTATQPHIPGIGPPPGEPLLAYDLHEKSFVLYEGSCRSIRRREKTHYQIVGELIPVWKEDDADHSGHFDQEGDTDWTGYLDAVNEDTGARE